MDTALRFGLRGEIDVATAPTLRENLAVLVTASGDDVILDCHDLTFMDSSGIHELIALRQALDVQGRSMSMINLNGGVRRVIEVCGLAEFLGLDTDD